MVIYHIGVKKAHRYSALKKSFFSDVQQISACRPSPLQSTQCFESAHAFAQSAL